MTRTSTEYYQQNRKTRRILYHCPHCSYETPNNKITLVNHINARHTPEDERPYQCQMCNRGFAQKAHLHIHYKKVHNHRLPERKIIAIAYIINITTQEGKSKKTKARQLYYKNNPIIKTSELNDKKHEYLPNIFMKQHDIHYDKKNGFITLNKCPVWQNTDIPDN